MSTIFIILLIVFLQLAIVFSWQPNIPQNHQHNNHNHHSRKSRVSDHEQELLNKAHRNAICCAKKLRCCNPKPPDIEIRAVLTRCPNTAADTASIGILTRTINKPITPDRENTMKTFQGFDEDELTMQTDITSCNRKLLLTINIKNIGETNCKNQFVVVDHVYDPVSDKSVRILNPYVVKIKQEAVAQTYGLQFLDYVNSEAKEQVFNKHDGNYTGCCMKVENSTCGVVRYHGKPIPYSQGFCCSCDAVTNARREPESDSVSPVIALSDPAFLVDSVQCPRNFYKGSEKFESRREQHRKREHNNHHHRNHKHDLDDSRVGIKSARRKDILSGAHRKIGSLEIKHNMKNHVFDEYDHGTNHFPYQESQRQSYKDLLTRKAREKRFLHDKQTPVVTSMNINKHLMDKNNKQGKMYLQKLTEYNEKNNANYMDVIKKMHHVGKHSTGTTNGRKFDVQIITDDGVRKLQKRQVLSSGVQARGGQNCADRYTPPGFDPDSYHESTHCLRFSDLWYGVYKLSKPQVAQTVYVQIFERFESDCHEEGSWRDLTKGTRVKLSTFESTYMDNLDTKLPSTISMKFSSKFVKSEESDELFKLDPHSRLLVPEGYSACDKYPEAEGGPEEYLILRPEEIVFEGNKCDRVGVGFEAFYKQPQRCSVPRGSCLQNQPKNLWRHDKKLDRRRMKGCYFLKHYAKITDNPIRKNASNGNKYLALEYSGEHLSVIDMEIKADFNAIIRPQSAAIITEVYIDSTRKTRSTLMIKVTNAGLLSNKFIVRLSDIPLEILNSFKNLESRVVLISPQNQHIFKLESNESMLPVDIFYCSVEVLSPQRELLALRRIRIQKADRCICTWHCLCACVGSSEGLKCKPMSLQHYHAAGFQGSLPLITYIDHYTLMDDIISVFMYLLLFIVATLLILGTTKSLIGLCSQSVGVWGLNVLLDLPKPLKRYYESSLKDKKVVYDNDGWPVHPKTGKRVRAIGIPIQLIVNTLFFFTYPLAVVGIITKKVLFKSKSTESSKTYCSDHDCSAKTSTCHDEICMRVYDYNTTAILEKPLLNRNVGVVARRVKPSNRSDVIMEEDNDEEDEGDVKDSLRRRKSYCDDKCSRKSRSRSNRSSSVKGSTTVSEDETTDNTEVDCPNKSTQYDVDARSTTDGTSTRTSSPTKSKECLYERDL